MFLRVRQQLGESGGIHTHDIDHYRGIDTMPESAERGQLRETLETAADQFLADCLALIDSDQTVDILGEPAVTMRL